MPKIVLEQLRFEECKSEKNGYLEIYNLNDEEYNLIFNILKSEKEEEKWQ